MRESRDAYEYAIPCRKCRPLIDTARRFTAARFPPDVLRVRAEWEGSPSLADCAAVARDVVGGRGRVWHGETGIGKTWTALAVGLSVVESVSVRWLHWPSFVRAMKDGAAGDGKLGAVVAARVGTPAVLIVDELAGRLTEFEVELVERVIGTRAETGAVIVTTNLTPEKAREYVGDRVWSRLGRSCRVGEIVGHDRRRRQ